MASTTFSQSKTPYTNYVVSELYPELIAQPEGGADNYEKIVRSMFLPVKSTQADVPSTFLILKPKSLWLVINGGNVKDIHGNVGTKIVNYSPQYTALEDKITINFLPYPLLLTKLFDEGSQELTAAQKLFGNITVVLAEDANSSNRARIAAPNILGDNSVTEAFSRWL
jgi:hypothetical protein